MSMLIKIQNLSIGAWSWYRANSSEAASLTTCKNNHHRYRCRSRSGIQCQHIQCLCYALLLTWVPTLVLVVSETQLAGSSSSTAVGSLLAVKASPMLVVGEGTIVSGLQWIAVRLASRTPDQQLVRIKALENLPSIMPTMWASAASCNASMALGWNLVSLLQSWAISASTFLFEIDFSRKDLEDSFFGDLQHNIQHVLEKRDLPFKGLRRIIATQVAWLGIVISDVEVYQDSLVRWNLRSSRYWNFFESN